MGLDLLCLLRSQHKMARLLLVGLVALCVASTKAAVIPMEEIVDGLQTFLTAPEESGLRLKRSTGEWDKEFDLSSMGILFQLKYTNPANPFEGGRAHVKVPGARFVSGAPFDDMEMDIEFNGGSAIDGLFDMKVDYKFIQKFMFLADRPQEGSFVLYRKLEGGMWKTRVTVDNNNRMPKPFLDIAVESDRKTKLHVLFNFEEDNKWELKIDRVPGQKMTIEAVIDGQKWTGVGTLNQGDMKLNLKVDSEFTGKHYTLDFDLNPAGMWGLHVTGDVDGPVDAKWTMQQDFYGMVFWYTGRYGKTVERKMTFVFDKINKSFLFVPKMSMNTVMTIDGEKTSEFVFDNTQAKKHIKFFWAPDAFTKDYLFTDEWEYPAGGCKWTTDLKRGGVSIWNWVGDYSFVNNPNKFEFKTMDKIVQTPMSPLYGLDHFYVGKYYKNGERTRTVTYEKQNRNFLLGKLFVEDKLVLDGERFGHFKLDTRATPYTMVWFSNPVRRLVPVTRDFVGQDELTVSAWHTPGKELKFETNLPEFQTMKVTSAGPTKTFWFNGEEKATVDFASSSKKASHTMHLPSGKDLTIDLAWPKMTPAASDLEFGVTITPDRKVVTKFGWEMAGVKEVYLDVVGNNPWIGDYKLSRQGEFEEISGSLYKIKWTGHGETTKGFLRRVSPVETNVVASLNTRNLKVDAIVWKSFAGKKYGFTMNNDKFTLLAGNH